VSWTSHLEDHLTLGHALDHNLGVARKQNMKLDKFVFKTRIWLTLALKYSKQLIVH